MIYAGIGSRNTPKDILDLMSTTASKLALDNWILRSGGADGSDSAFEDGACLLNGQKEIYLPWKGFNDNLSPLFLSSFSGEIQAKAKNIAKKYHPAWDKLSQGAQKLHTRNVFQVLGKTLDKPCNMVICYAEIKNGQPQGGTAQALRIANDYDITIYNLYNETDFLKIYNYEI